MTAWALELREPDGSIWHHDPVEGDSPEDAYERLALESDRFGGTVRDCNLVGIR